MNKYINVMVDLETLAVSPRAAVIEIGMYTEIGGVRYSFHDSMSYEYYLNNNTVFEVDPNTLDFHLNKNLINLERTTRSTHTCFEAFATNAICWLEGMANTHGRPIKIWANGTDFDLPILENLFRESGYTIMPWKYNDKGDYRTMRDLFSHYIPPKLKNDNKHSALADATYQYKALESIMRNLGKEF